MGEDRQGLERLHAVRTTRRRFLTVTGAAAAAALTTGLPERGVATARHVREYPFTLGVASGDPLPDGVVLWTRIAPAPLEPFGGMDYAQVPVGWQVATDERFRRVVRAGTAAARPELAHSVHVDVRGLQPGREYFYRFRAGQHVSPIGRTKTAPHPQARLAQLTFAFASCQAWWDGHFTAYRDMAAQDHDVVLHLGDYLYEYGIPADGGARQTPVDVRFQRETVTLDEYRERYALYKTDPDLQAAHAAAPWIVTLDDHEVENNWADEIPETPVPRDEFLVRRANAFRAFWEHMPLRALAQPQGWDMQMYRRFAYGDLAELSLLDTRQYRSDQAAGDGAKPPNPEASDPARTMLGAEQEQWTLDGLGASTRRWNVLAQQVPMLRVDLTAGPNVGLPMDAWDGYTASRDRLLHGIVERDVDNVVVLTGDFHRSVASGLRLDYDDPDSPTVATEFIGTSISSGRDGEPVDEVGRTIVGDNPWVDYYNSQRGYVRCTVTPDQWRSDYRVAPYISRPGAALTTDASLVVQAGVPGIERA